MIDQRVCFDAQHPDGMLDQHDEEHCERRQLDRRHVAARYPAAPGWLAQEALAELSRSNSPSNDILLVEWKIESELMSYGLHLLDRRRRPRTYRLWRARQNAPGQKNVTVITR